MNLKLSEMIVTYFTARRNSHTDLKYILLHFIKKRSMLFLVVMSREQTSRSGSARMWGARQVTRVKKDFLNL